MSHAVWQPPAEEESEHSTVASHQEWSADAPHTVEEAESADEYSVPRLRARKEVIVRRPDAEGNILTKREWIPLRKRQRDTVIESSSDSEINSSIHLADSFYSTMMVAAQIWEHTAYVDGSSGVRFTRRSREIALIKH